MKNWLVVCLVSLIVTSCAKESGRNNSASGTDFSSYIAYDVSGNQLEYINDPSDDYKDESWPQWVYDLFQPLDTVNRVDMEKPTTLNVRALYPNPCGDTQRLAIYTVAPVNLKIAIIDSRRNRYYLRSTPVYVGQQVVSLNYNTVLMPGGVNYRLFYAFSSEKEAFFKRGHIDFLKQ